MFDWITGVVREMGYLGIGLLTLLENVFPPIPSELIMPLAGFVARRGEMSIWLAMLAGTIGSFIGALGWYYVARRIGETRLRGWTDRHGKWLGITCDDIDRARDWFARRGAIAILIGRLIPGVRTLISVPAGFARMSLVSFTLYTFAGTAIWTAGLTYAGYVLGANYEQVAGVIDPISWVVVGLLVLVPIVRAVRHRHREAH